MKGKNRNYLLTLWRRWVCPNRIVQVFLWFCLRSKRRWERPSQKSSAALIKYWTCRDSTHTQNTLVSPVLEFTSVYQCLTVFVLTCFSLPLVKHGDIVLRILFHLSSLTTVTPSSKGPEKRLSCRHKDNKQVSTGNQRRLFLCCSPCGWWTPSSIPSPAQFWWSRDLTPLKLVHAHRRFCTKHNNVIITSPLLCLIWANPKLIRVCLSF